MSANWKWSNDLRCAAAAACLLCCAGAANAQPLDPSKLSDATEVSRRLSQSNADERRWSERFVQIAQASEASGNWSAAAKAYAEAAIVVPTTDTMRGLVRATLMLPRLDAADRHEAKRRDFMSALRYLEVLREMGGSPGAAAAEDLANRDCIVAYLADRPPCPVLQKALAASGLQDAQRR